MGVVTCNGQAGSGAREVGREVARLLGYEYVDSRILFEAARKARASVEAVAERETRRLGVRDRIASFLRTFLQHSALATPTGEGVPSPELYELLSRHYEDVVREPITEAHRLNDRLFIEVTTAVIQEIAEEDNVVIVGRGSNVILRDRPATFHVGFVAPLELRIRTIMEREKISWQEAEKQVQEEEAARLTFYRKFFKVDALDPTLYHMVLNMGSIDVKTAAEAIVRAATKVIGGNGVPQKES